ncbi:MAG: NADH-quinone oxidoreductase subunit A [Ignavibacteriaceae bacterium]|nr:NADH-quinone oxidoreductase subunit A [Ignavibacteriaceae bacterium]
MLTEFGKIFVFLLVAVIFVIALVIVAWLIRPSRPTKEKLMTYECGENPEGSPWVKFNIRFYVVALIFLIFDVEVVLLIPWALVYRQFGLGGFMVGAIFLIMLGLGMAYEWRKGDLEWERAKIIPPVIKRPVFSSKETREAEPVKSKQLV